MYKIEPETLAKCYRPYDVVSDKDGNVGFIQEVNLNECQVGFNDQVSYAVCWLVGNNTKHAWFSHADLDRHSNIFDKIARASCHPFGSGHRSMDLLNGSPHV